MNTRSSSSTAQWVDPAKPATLDVINPATEELAGNVAVGSSADVDKAVAAARRAFTTWSTTPVADRVALLERIAAEYQNRAGDLGAALTEEMGAPKALANGFQINLGAGHLDDGHRGAEGHTPSRSSGQFADRQGADRRLRH